MSSSRLGFTYVFITVTGSISLLVNY